MDRVRQAMRVVERRRFLPAAVAERAGLDRPLPIGHGQTNSQPTTVRLLLGWLDPQPGETILDVGSGSGWTTALLSHLVGDGGHVHAVERVPELVDLGVTNCAAAEVEGVTFHQAGAELGLPDLAPFDRILVSAAAREVPAALAEQLRPGGRLVVPVGTAVVVGDLAEDGPLHTEQHEGFRFVPLL